MRQEAAVDLLIPSEGLASERSHVKQHGAPHGLSQLQIPLLFLSVPRSLSPPSYFSFDPCISLSLCLSVTLLQSTVSLLCLAPGLLPHFSVNLEFEINLSLSPLTSVCPLFCSLVSPILPFSSLSLQLYSSVLFHITPLTLPPVSSVPPRLSVSPKSPLASYSSFFSPTPFLLLLTLFPGNKLMHR